MNYSELDTPALLIEKKTMLGNIEKMQKIAETSGVKLRPHTKTHKIPEIAKLQIENGASGIAVAKLSEAEIMADAGLDDIQIANIIVSDNKIERLIELNKKLKSLSCNVDSKKAARAIAEKFDKLDIWLDVFIEINSGQNRSGLTEYKDIYNLAKFIQDLPGINLVGLFTHAGHAYAADSHEQIKEIGKKEAELLIELANRLMEERIYIAQISVGSTPTAPYCSKIEGVTEIRPGNYIFHDIIQTELGVCSMDECALSILATVISMPDSNRVIIDAGAKALSKDKGASKLLSPDGFGYVIGKNCSIERLNEEHGIITHNGETFSIGEKIRIIPNHACVVINLFDTAALIDNNKVITQYEIKGRGKSQ
jgi:D-serine deaminase-like pyridoxal phosphate-dependent protein